MKIKNFLNSHSFSTSAMLTFKAVLCGFVICFALSMTDFDAQSQEISDEVFRLHILANSDSEEDQNLKLAVRDEVQKFCYNIYGNAKTKEDAEKILADKLPQIIEIAQNEVYEKGYDYPIKGEIVNMYFTNRVYDNITLPAGDYDAVRITIGEGKGHNWWCVMFPPICISAADNTADISDVLSDEQTDLVTDSSYEYKFKIYEIYQNITNFLSEQRPQEIRGGQRPQEIRGGQRPQEIREDSLFRQ